MGILGGSDIERIGNYINKSNISLDEFVGGKLICKGFVGTKITISSIAITYAFGSPIEVTITENSKQYQNSDVVKYETVLVPLDSSTSIRVQYEDYDISMMTNFSFPITHLVSYSLEKIIFESDVAGTYSLDVPANVSDLVISAIGGGGGGMYAFAHASGYSGSGGNGGFAGSSLQNSSRAVTPSSTLSITIGAGGTAGVVNRSNNTGTPAGTGGSTVISGGGLGVTLIGGNRNGNGVGGAGKSNTLKEIGNVGVKGNTTSAITGGNGGKGGYYGSTTSGGGGGGGGDGSIFGVGGNGGKGGNAGTSTPTPTYWGGTGSNGTRGAGGGGGGGTGGDMSSSALGGDGGKGGDGYVLIKSRITV